MVVVLLVSLISKTQNDIIVNTNINEKEMHLHTMSPIDSKVTCIVKVIIPRFRLGKS